MAKRNVILSIIGTLLVLLAAWIIWGNCALQLTKHTISSPVIPEEFSGYKIAHISDLHNAQFGNNNQRLLQILEHTQPDIIAITGDIIDSRNTQIQVALDFAAQAIKIAPCYYVTGNHEARIAEYSQLKDGLKELGVVVLEDSITEISKGENSIILAGVNDPSFQTEYLLGDSESVIKTSLQELPLSPNSFTVLLSHRPELFQVYSQVNIDLVLCGHAHGGQFRLPIIGGLFAPNQGFFPKYDAGLYTEGHTSMIVSRGIGNSLFPFRIANRPEVILLELQST